MSVRLLKLLSFLKSLRRIIFVQLTFLLKFTRSSQYIVQSYKEVLELVNMDHICSFAISNFFKFAIIDARTNSNGNQLDLFTLEN